MTRIGEMREKLGIKQEEIALLCNVNQSTVSLWESGKTVPRKSALRALADRFGVTAGYLLGIEGSDANEAMMQNPELTTEEYALSMRYRRLSSKGKRDVLNFMAFTEQMDQDKKE